MGSLVVLIFAPSAMNSTVLVSNSLFLVSLLQVTMESVKAEIAALSNKELYDKLRALNENVCPITPATRKMFEKRLLKRLCGESAVEDTSEKTKTDVNLNSSDNKAACADKSISEAENTEEDKNASPSVYYGVQILPEDCSELGTMLSPCSDGIIYPSLLFYLKLSSTGGCLHSLS